MGNGNQRNLLTSQVPKRERDFSFPLRRRRGILKRRGEPIPLPEQASRLKKKKKGFLNPPSENLKK